MCFGLCSSLALIPVHAELYKWTDADGTVHYTDTPPPDNRPQIEIKGTISSYTSAEVVAGTTDAGDSNPTKKSAKPSNKSVVMYSADWCGVCKKARAYFQQQGIAFREYDIDTSEQGKRGFAKLGGKGVPVILVDQQRMNGFSAGQFEQLYLSP
jgi:glutaredoxin